MSDDVVKTMQHTSLEERHVAYFYSWPLIGGMAGSPIAPIEQLDFDKEYELLRESIQMSNYAVRISKQTATSTNFGRTITVGCRVLHYTGHGFKSGLAFEAEDGGMHLLPPAFLREMVGAGGSASCIKLAVVTACQSQQMGLALVEAGIPHVIAVKSSAKLQDLAAHIFITHCYLSLFLGQTVKQAFARGQVAVRTDERIKTNEADSFLLLPDDADHDEKVFGDLEPGAIRELNPPPAPSYFIFPPTPIPDRQFQIQQAVQHITKGRRLVSIIGRRGIGKSVVALFTAKYLHDRGKFNGGTFLLELESNGPAQPLAKLVAEVMVNSGASDITKETASTGQLCMQLRRNPDKKFLFLLDGVTDLHKEEPQADMNVLHFVNHVLECPNVKILVTSDKMLTGMKKETECLVKLEPLTPATAAKFFYENCPNGLPATEYGCTNPREAGIKLGQHGALKLCEGNPWLLFKTAQIRHERSLKLDDMIPLVQTLVDEFNHQDAADTTSAPDTAVTPPPVAPLQPVLSPQEMSAQQDLLELQKFWGPLGGDAVPWAKLEMKLKARFVMQTRLQRGLSNEDYKFLHQKLVNGQATVTLNQLAQTWPLWRFVEKVLPKVQYLWSHSSSLMHGFIGSGEAAALLQGFQPHTFLLRFSTNQPCLAVALVVFDRNGLSAPQHVLINFDEHHAQPFSYQGAGLIRAATMEELLRNEAALQYFYATPQPIPKADVL